MKTIIGGSGWQQALPPYSIGNSEESKYEAVSREEAHKKNLEILKALKFCSKKLLYKKIAEVIKSDGFMEEKIDDSLSKSTSELKKSQVNCETDTQSSTSTKEEISSEEEEQSRKDTRQEETFNPLHGSKEGLTNPEDRDSSINEEGFDGVRRHISDSKNSQTE